jgi:DNA-binding response OmpR family regulator
LDGSAVKIEIVENNAEAVKAVRRKDFDILITDYGRKLPLNDSGADFAREVSSLHYGAPLLFFTARPEDISTGLNAVLITNNPVELLGTNAELAVSRQKWVK